MCRCGSAASRGGSSFCATDRYLKGGSLSGHRFAVKCVHPTVPVVLGGFSADLGVVQVVAK